MHDIFYVMPVSLMYNIFTHAMCMGAQFWPSGCSVPALLSWYSTTFHKIVIDVMTSGLPQVNRLWLGVSNGVLPIKYLTQKIMAFNYCGRQVARMLFWVAPAYHKKEGAAPLPGASKFNFQYDRRPMSALGAGWDVEYR